MKVSAKFGIKGQNTKNDSEIKVVKEVTKDEKCDGHLGSHCCSKCGAPSKRIGEPMKMYGKMQQLFSCTKCNNEEWI